MRRIGAPVARAAVYVFAFAFWAFAMLFTYNLIGVIARGHIEKYWFALLILMFGLGVLFAEFSRYLIRFGVPKAAALFQSAMPADIDVQTSNSPLTKDTTAMSKNENPSFTFSQPVTINASTNHNAPGGIISNAPVTVNQYYDKPKSISSIIDAEIIEPASASTDTEQQKPNPEPAADDDVIDINGLIAYSVKVKSPGVSRNTIDKILRDANIKPCRTEKDGRAIRNLYPAKEAKAAIREYFDDKDN